MMMGSYESEDQGVRHRRDFPSGPAHQAVRRSVLCECCGGRMTASFTAWRHGRGGGVGGTASCQFVRSVIHSNETRWRRGAPDRLRMMDLAIRISELH